MSTFYQFNQNNSGGRFEFTTDIALIVNIEANSSSEALQIAETKGIYFNGVEDRIDCPCCGDRWSTCCEEVKEDKLNKVNIDKALYSINNDNTFPIIITHYLDKTKKVLSIKDCVITEDSGKVITNYFKIFLVGDKEEQFDYHNGIHTTIEGKDKRVAELLRRDYKDLIGIRVKDVIKQTEELINYIRPKKEKP